MLLQISVQNFATIDQITVTWQPGLNVITGETGAGKSIIIDAVGALLGDRLGAEVVRAGAARALVEGVFSVPPERVPPELAAALEEYGLELDGDSLIISREILAGTGRGVARINGRAVPLAALQEIGRRLVDVHGQSEHLSLLRVREHLELLDSYAGLAAERRSLADLVRRLRQVRAELRRLQEEERRAVREQELLRHEIAEIEAAGLRPDEEEELLRRRQRLRNLERLRLGALRAWEALSGGDEGVGALAQLGEAIRACRELARYDPQLAQEAEALESALALADESARDLRRYLDALEEDPGALEAVEERLLLLAELKRKYGDTVADVLRYLDEARQRLTSYERREETMAELQAEEAELLPRAGCLAAELSARRRAAALALAQAVERELGDLNLTGARFEVAFSQAPDPQGLPVAGADGASPQLLAFDATGVDRVEFLFSANPGEPPKPLQKIASGGELARVTLALKTILSRADPRPTLIFDEIDVGIGGRTGSVVGQKLWGLAAHHQVLCVTHLPQVAAYADLHLVVSKRVEGERSRTRVAPVEDEERLSEIAAMLAGAPSGAARENARELLERSAAWKSRAGVGRE